MATSLVRWGLDALKTRLLTAEGRMLEVVAHVPRYTDVTAAKAVPLHPCLIAEALFQGTFEGNHVSPPSSA